MPLTSCKECGAQISTSAASCPHCGAPVRKKMGRGCAGVLLILFGIIALALLMPSDSKKNTPCHSDWTKCTDNADLVNSYLSDYRAQNDCKHEAERRAKYGNPQFPTLFYFGTFYKGDQYPKTGTATLIEEEAQYQNGFGAMVHSQVTCTYDLRSKRVLNIDIAPR